MSEQPRHIRIFLSSPGDVADERKIALEVIDQLPDRPAFRDKVTMRVIAWDKPGAGTPMLATMTPQEAINQGLPTPGQCDIVIVIFWARLGTPLPFPEYQKPDGEPYLSGTEWEYVDAFNAAQETGKPLLIVYRRTEKVLLDDEAPDFEDKLLQKHRVREFFAAFVDSESGAIRQGYNQYEKPEDFRREFEHHLETLVLRALEKPAVTPADKVSDTPTAVTKTWAGSPFPGLRAFTEAQAPIYFGRGRETDALIEKVSQSRFVGVVGASGSGKSSLVAAGLIPRLRANAISGENVGSKDWHIVRFTPGENPFDSLAGALLQTLPGKELHYTEFAQRKTDLAQKLGANPTALVDTCAFALKDEAERELIDAFANARLLTTNSDDSVATVCEIALFVGLLPCLYSQSPSSPLALHPSV
jgi:hypothetical protein